MTEKIKLDVYEVLSNDKKLKLWNMFKEHHYLSNSLNSGASRVFVAYWEDKIIAYRAVMILPNGDIRDFYMGHRLVVLPDYQGLGIGTKFNNWCGEFMLSQGYKYYCKTSHFKLKNYYKNSLKWKVISEECRKFKENDLKYKNSLREGVNPFTYTKPFKVYDMSDDRNGMGKNLAHWYNRPLISVRYLGNDYVNKQHKIIVCEAVMSRNDFVNFIKPLIEDDFYYEIICGNTNNNDEECLGCHDLGICSYPFEYRNYKHVNDVLNSEIDIANVIYIYDEKHKLFYDKFNSLGIKCIESDKIRIDDIFEM